MSLGQKSEPQPPHKLEEPKGPHHIAQAPHGIHHAPQAPRFNPLSSSPYAEQMKETEYKHCKRDRYGAETCDEIIQKYVTEEPAQEWEKLSPQPAAYRQDMTAE